MRYLVTGGAGFIGTNFTRYLAADSAAEIVVLDKLTYAGRRENLADLESSGRIRFVEGDICDPAAASRAMAGADIVVNFAAETHVDRSIEDPSGFVRTDVEGVRVLLEEFRRAGGGSLFLQISTDEVYGSVEKGRSREGDTLRPRSPYSASKAGGELLAMSYFTTWGVPVIVTRASNNYGPWQYPEKLIPLFITNAMEGKDLPLYGDGLNKRDWLFVDDHCSALSAVIGKGRPGSVFNIGSGEEQTNIEVTTSILDLVGADRELIRPVSDRPGHDRRYALDTGLILSELGWRPSVGFREGLARTVKWYEENRAWWEEIKSGRFGEYYRRMYSARLAASGGQEG